MKKKGGKLKWIVIIVIVIAAISMATKGGNNDSSTGNTESNTASSEKKDTKKSEKKKIEYKNVSASELMKALEDNAAAASDKYKGKYLRITGRVSTIDSDCKYITVLPGDDEYAIIGIQCNTQNDKQKNDVKKLSKDKKIVVKGKCTDVGEVMGYSLDIDAMAQ